SVCVFRVAQEVLQNAVKYSHAQHVAVRLSGESGRLVLSAEDDGVGSDRDAAGGRGLGLLSMRERVEAIGGDLKIRSTPGAGTSVRVSVPLTAADAGAVAVWPAPRRRSRRSGTVAQGAGERRSRPRRGGAESGAGAW